MNLQDIKKGDRVRVFKQNSDVVVEGTVGELYNELTLDNIYLFSGDDLAYPWTEIIEHTPRQPDYNAHREITIRVDTCFGNPGVMRNYADRMRDSHRAAAGLLHDVAKAWEAASA